MENASKALIIAGSILIAIVIIGVAIYIYSTGQKPLEESASQMDAQAIASYNSKFEAYAGGNKKGSEIVELAKAVNSNNKNNQADGPNNIITFIVKGSNYTNDPLTANDQITFSTKYTVRIEYWPSGANKGLVQKITVT